MGERLDWLKLAKGGLPGGSVSKESTCNARDTGSIPRLGRYPGEGNDNPLPYSFLGNKVYMQIYISN